MSFPSTIRSAATHGGPFHSDDVLAGALLLAAFPTIEFVRTRDPDELARHTLVFDVGGTHDADALRLDHHFTPPPRRDDGTLLSSAGLRQHAAIPMLKRTGVPTPVVPVIAAKLEESVIRIVDAVDTGTHRHGSPPLWMGALVSEMPAWNEQPTSPEAARHCLDESYRRQVAIVAFALRILAARVSTGEE